LLITITSATDFPVFVCFRKIAKATTISFVISVCLSTCPSVRME